MQVIHNYGKINCGKYAGNTIEIDIMMIAEPRKITKTELQDMLTQAQDL